jgi:hypothetical protein
MHGFELFCTKAGIKDAVVTTDTVDRMFITVNFDGVEMVDQNDHTLCRYEFMESLVRLARAKYIDTQRESTLAKAVQRLIEKDILTHWVWEPWQEFRDKQLWTRGVCDVIQTNLDGITKVYVAYSLAEKVGSKAMFTKLSAIKLFVKDVSLTTEHEVTRLFGLSKMTIPNEVKDAMKYHFLTLAEFCEMLARVADLKFQEEGSLFQRMEMVLDIVLGQVKVKRIPVKQESNEWSESDDDY